MERGRAAGLVGRTAKTIVTGISRMPPRPQRKGGRQQPRPRIKSTHEYKKGPRPTRTGPSPQKLLRQSPTLPQPPSCSTISANGLSYRDRNGYPGVPPPLSPPQNPQTTTPNTPVRR